MTDDDAFEREVAARLRALADAEQVPAGLAMSAGARVEQMHGRRRSRRLVSVGALAAAGLVATSALAMAALGDRDPDLLRTIDHATTTDPPQPAPSTTASMEPAPEPSTTTVPPKSTTTTSYPARPGCAAATGKPQPKSDAWARYYKTEPANDQPARVEICLDRTSASVGQEVSVTLIGDDPDAVIVDEECGWEVRWGDTEPPGNLCRDYIRPSDQPEDTPKPEPGHIERSATHTFSAPGTYTVTGVVWSSKYDGRPSPYSSYAEVQISIVIEG